MYLGFLNNQDAPLSKKPLQSDHHFTSHESWQTAVHDYCNRDSMTKKRTISNIVWGKELPSSVQTAPLLPIIRSKAALLPL